MNEQKQSNLPQTEKRFIAGATCPKCSEQDCLQMYKVANDYMRQCVNCDFSEVLSEEKNVNIMIKNI